MAKLAPAGQTLPPYQADTTCPKCGHDQIGSHYVPDGCDEDDFCPICDREHMRRTCHRCRYQWAEAVIGDG